VRGMSMAKPGDSIICLILEPTVLTFGPASRRAFARKRRPCPTATVTVPDQADLCGDIVRILAVSSHVAGDLTGDTVQSGPVAGLEVVKSSWSG
jgi:hypothetical protein